MKLSAPPAELRPPCQVAIASPVHRAVRRAEGPAGRLAAEDATTADLADATNAYGWHVHRVEDAIVGGQRSWKERQHRTTRLRPAADPASASGLC